MNIEKKRIDGISLTPQWPLTIPTDRSNNRTKQNHNMYIMQVYQLLNSQFPASTVAQSQEKAELHRYCLVPHLIIKKTNSRRSHSHKTTQFNKKTCFC